MVSPRNASRPGDHRSGHRRSPGRWAGLLLVVLLGVGSLGASCGQAGLSLMPGVVNDTANRSLRRAVLGFATEQICDELRARSIPLALRPDDPALGRFFPTSCAVQELANENLFVQFAGHGYGWSNLTGRLGFEAAAAVEYRQDFLMDGSTMYVYFRQKQVQSTDFRVLMVEQGTEVPAGGVAGGAIAQVLGTSVAAAAEQVGSQILRHQLAQGFTVVRENDGTVSFTLGLLEKGQRPALPFDRGESDWLILANERTELHVGQRDYTGPFTIEDDDEALYLTAVLEGAPFVDVLVIGKAAGDRWIGSYERQPVAPPPPTTPISDEFLEAATPVPNQALPPWRRTLRLPPGSYYVVFDNTASAGRTAPSAVALDDRAALVSYAVQLGDAP